MSEQNNGGNGKDIAPRNTAAMAMLNSLRTGLNNVTAAMPSTHYLPYLRMEKDGGWVFGPDNIRVGPADRVVVSPLTLEHGYTCWTRHDKQKNEKLGEQMVRFDQPKPILASLPRHDPWTWQECLAIQMKFNKGPNVGEQVLYNTTSYGGMEELGKLIKVIQARVEAGRADVFPVITLGHDSYLHKQYGKTYTPVFTIVGWVDMNGDKGPDDEPVDSGPDDGAIERAAEAAQTPAAQATRERTSDVPAAKVETTRERLLRELAEAEAAEQAALNVAAAGPPPVQRRRRTTA